MREGNGSPTPRDAGASAAQHTPGPWTCYADLPSVEPNWHIVTNASRMRVLANVHIEPGNAVDTANARLITAAPELLAALQALKSLPIDIEGALGNTAGDERSARMDGLQSIFEQVDEAIAKATQPAASRGEATPNPTAELGA